MYKLYPYITNDGSVGLYSPSDKDIYHSVTGAATEAYEKFIFPVNLSEYILSHDSIRVLDICYGIGYNSKSFLNFIFQNYLKNFSQNYINCGKILSVYNDKIHTDNKNNTRYNEPIHIDNNLSEFDASCNEEIYGDKIIQDSALKKLHERVRKKISDKNFKIYIKAIDTDKNLGYLSPFISGKLNNKKIEKIKKNDKSKNTPQNPYNLPDLRINNFKHPIPDCYLEYSYPINKVILDSIINNNNEILSDKEFMSIINDKNYKEYFSEETLALYSHYQFKMGINGGKIDFRSFLHNIYYKYLSIRHKMGLKTFNLANVDFNLKINDARLELLADKNTYNFVFLDGFTPSKCPCLWTIDFLKLIKDHLDNDGILLTYSSAAPVRNALFELGFEVGKIINPVSGESCGTIAAKKSKYIKKHLSESDLDLLKTRAGIFYRDENLSAPNEAIIAAREEEVKNSDLISTTQYKKQQENYE